MVLLPGHKGKHSRSLPDVSVQLYRGYTVIFFPSEATELTFCKRITRKSCDNGSLARLKPVNLVNCCVDRRFTRYIHVWLSIGNWRIIMRSQTDIYTLIMYKIVRGSSHCFFYTHYVVLCV